MKNLLKLFLITITLCAIVMGCADNHFKGTYIDENNSEKCILTISYGGETIRSILPNEWDGSTLYYKIEGQSSRLYKLNPTTIEFGVDGKAKLALEYDDWELILKAYKDEACTKQVLQGTAFADLTNGDTSITFVLKAKNLTEPGTLSLSGTYVDTESVVTKYRMALKNFYTGAEIKSEEVTSPDGTFAFSSTDDVAPGTYLFEIRFYNDADKAIGYWSEEVIIDAGNTTQKDGITIDVIMKKPASPENLKAYLVDGSEKDEKYNLKLTWEDKSTNEENFVLTINEYDIDGNEVPYATLSKDFWESPIRVSGSLLAGNKECVITLPTGRLFEVSIAAENVVGLSDSDTGTDGNQPCERVDSTADAETGYTGLPVENKIARVKITYNLNNGTLKFDADEDGISGKYIVYETYEGANIPLMTPDTTDINATPSEAIPTLIKNNQPFKEWLKEGSTTTTVVTETNLFENINVKASFNSSYTVDYEIENHKDLESSRVSAKDKDGNSCINGEVTLTEDGTITFEVVSEVTDEPTYTNLKVIISDYEYNSTDIVDGKLTKTIDIRELGRGIHTVNVCAYDTNAAQWYSYSFTVTIVQ